MEKNPNIHKLQRGYAAPTAGVIIFVAVSQFLIMLIAAESIQPGYNVGTNAISDLGVGRSAAYFNTSIVILGTLTIISSYFLFVSVRSRLFSALFAVFGASSAGVGLFPETTGLPHDVFAFVIFSATNIAAILCLRVLSSPLRYASAALGIFGLVSLALFSGREYLGIGFGGMERMIVYPVLIWTFLLAGHLLS